MPFSLLICRNVTGLARWALVSGLLQIGVVARAAPPDAPQLPDSPPSPVTSVREVFRVSQDDKDRPIPVDLEGVVLLAIPQGPSFFFHDGDMGIHINQPDDTLYTNGERVRLIGDARRRRFAPSVVLHTIERLGPGLISPPPKNVSFSELVAGLHDSQWVEIQAVISKIQPSPDKELLILEAIRDGQRLRIAAGPPYPPDPDAYLDAEVRIRGVSGARFNTRDQMVEAVLYVNDVSWMEIIRPPPTDPYALPARPVNRLMEFAPDSQPWHRIKVSGVVTRRISSHLFFLRNQDYGIRIQSLNPVHWQPGDVIEAVGFPIIVEGEVVIENSISRHMGTAALPHARPATPLTILNNQHSSNLVQLQGRLIDSVTGGSDATLVFEADNHLFKAHLKEYPTETVAALLPENGSLVDITGICEINELQDFWYRLPSSFSILISSPEDLAVIAKPSWWTPTRLTGVLAITLALLIAGSGWVWALRRQVNRTRSVIESQARHAAVLEERTRIGHDLHDTLEQGLTGLSLQLKGIETDLQTTPHPAGSRLSLAQQMLRQCRGLARDAIRRLRVESSVPDQENLLTTLRQTVEMWNRSGALTAKLKVTGTPVELPSEIERNLRGIGMEAVTNAVKHGRSSQVHIDVGFGPTRIELKITDNGSGFDPDRIPRNRENSYGLAGMRERCLSIGATLTIKSVRGQGTSITVSSPYTPPLLA